MANIVERKLDEQMQPAFEKITESIDKLSQSGTDRIGEVLSFRANEQIESLTSFLRDMQSEIGKQIVEARQVPAEINSRLLNNALQIGDMITKNAEKAAERQQRAVASLQSTVLDAIIENNEKLSGNIETAVSVGEKRTNALKEDLQKLFDKFAEDNSDRTEDIKQFQRLLGEETAKTTDAVATSAAELTAALNDTTEAALSAVKASSAELNENMRAVTDAVTGTLAMLTDERSESLQNSLQSIEAAFSAIKAISPSLIERMTAVEATSSALKSLSERTTEASDVITKATLPIAQAADRLTSIADELAEKWEKTQRSNRRQLKDIADQLKQINAGTTKPKAETKSETETGSKTTKKKS